MKTKVLALLGGLVRDADSAYTWPLYKMELASTATEARPGNQSLRTRATLRR